MTLNLCRLCGDILGSDNLLSSHVDDMTTALAALAGGATPIPLIEEQRRLAMFIFESRDVPVSRNAGINQCATLLWRRSHYWHADYATTLEGFERLLRQMEEEPTWTLYDGSHPWLEPRKSLETFASASILQGDPGRWIATHVEGIAGRRLMELACGIARHRLQTGELPAAPGAVAGEWTDPFTGKRLEYTVTAAGFTLRSAGKDGKMDAPDARPANDLVLRIERR